MMETNKDNITQFQVGGIEEQDSLLGGTMPNVSSEEQVRILNLVQATNDNEEKIRRLEDLIEQGYVDDATAYNYFCALCRAGSHLWAVGKTEEAIRKEELLSDYMAMNRDNLTRYEVSSYENHAVVLYPNLYEELGQLDRAEAVVKDYLQRCYMYTFTSISDDDPFYALEKYVKLAYNSGGLTYAREKCDELATEIIDNYDRLDEKQKVRMKMHVYKNLALQNTADAGDDKLKWVDNSTDAITVVRYAISKVGELANILHPAGEILDGDIATAFALATHPLPFIWGLIQTGEYREVKPLTPISNPSWKEALFPEGPYQKSEVRVERPQIQGQQTQGQYLWQANQGNNNVQQQPYSQAKNKTTAGVLGLLLGGWGIHNFYLGFKQTGFIQLGLSVFGLMTTVIGIGIVFSLVAGIWGFIDAIRIFTGSIYKDANGTPLV